jgi:acyl-CoA synthetase (AMP-forming)/AMP-acid ligase II
MLFNTLLNVAEKYPNKLAINDITYSKLLDIIANRSYDIVCKNTGVDVLLDILTAAYHNKPIFILPKYNRDEVIISDHIDREKFQIVLYSSGSTGSRKQIFVPEEMILKNADNSVKCQNLSKDDKILTVCSLNHTGGINAQTIAGLTVGAHIIVKEFNPFNFFKILETEKITVTHLIPIMIDSLIKVDNARYLEDLRIVMAGSDCVYKHHVEFWNNLSVDFIVNYGLTEAGPIIINHKFTKGSSLDVFDQGVPLGTDVWCDYKINDGELLLKGKEVNSEEWFKTGDCVEVYKNWILYKGRKSAGCKIVPKQYNLRPTNF